MCPAPSVQSSGKSHPCENWGVLWLFLAYTFWYSHRSTSGTSSWERLFPRAGDKPTGPKGKCETGTFFFNCVLTRGRTNGSGRANSSSWGKRRWFAALSVTQSSHNKSWPLQPQERRFHFIFFLWAKPWGLYSVSAPRLLVCQSKSLWLELSKSWESGPVLAEAPLVSGGVSSDWTHCRAHFLLWFRWALKASIPLIPPSPMCPPGPRKGALLSHPQMPGREKTRFAAGTKVKLQDF